MAEAITYTEMSFTGKHRSYPPRVSLKEENIVTYAAVKNLPENKKKKKKNDNKSQRVSPEKEKTSFMYAAINKPKKPAKTAEVSQQKEETSFMYAFINKPKKAAKIPEVSQQKKETSFMYAFINKPKKAAKTAEVSPQMKDQGLMYADINKPEKSAKKDSRISAHTAEGGWDEEEDPRAYSTTTWRRKTWMKDMRKGEKRLKLLILVLAVLCLVLLTVVIMLGVTGGNEQKVTEQSNPRSSDSSGGSHGCPPLWIAICGKCYLFSDTKKPCPESKRDCEEQNSTLATTKEEAILRLVRVTGKEFWIGLTHFTNRDGKWQGKWADGSTEIITEGIGSCAKLGNNLTLENCYISLPWICQRDAV